MNDLHWFCLSVFKTPILNLRTRLPLFMGGIIVFVLFGLAIEQAVAGRQVLHVELDEWRIKMDRRILGPGNVTFKAVNKGTLLHEMVVIKTDVPADAFEVENGKVNEDAVGVVIGEIESFSPGVNKEVTFELSEGSYVLFCNNLERNQSEGHYQRGMHLPFTVRPHMP